MSTNQVVFGSIVLNDVHDGTHLVIGKKGGGIHLEVRRNITIAE